MRKIYIIGIIISFVTLLESDSSDWQDNSSWSNNKEKEDLGNSIFKQIEIKNRSKKKYKDKIYKYIKGNYEVENNNIQLANIELDDNLQNKDIKINILSDDIKVEGNRFKDSIKLKHNKYKHFVNHDESIIGFNDDKDNKQDSSSQVSSTIIDTDPLYTQIKEDDISEIEVINLRNKHNIKEVNVYMERVNIHVKN